MSEIDMSGVDAVRQEQMLAAARALAAWAHTRQAVWSGVPVPVPSAHFVAEPQPALPNEPLPPEWPAETEPAPSVDWSGLAARAGSLARSGLPSIGRALTRAAMAGAVIAIFAMVIVSGRKGLQYWQRRSAEKPVTAASAIAKPAVVATVPAPARERRQARSERAAAAALELPKLPAGIGWIKIVSPFTVNVSEDGHPVWLYDDIAKLPSGTHRLQFENRQFGYESEQRVVVQPGGQTTVSVVPPPSTITVNAASGSEVSIDGTVVGPAPLVDFSLPLGMHDVVVKDQAGVERRFTVTVTPAPVVLNVQ